VLGLQVSKLTTKDGENGPFGSMKIPGLLAGDNVLCMYPSELTAMPIHAFDSARRMIINLFSILALQVRFFTHGISGLH
jgi:hypothetical protein